MQKLVVTFIIVFVAWPAAGAQEEKDPLPSWNAGRTKQAIVGFVHAVTEKGPSYLPPAERIAVFDNDGTLWCEQPVYSQVIFCMDRVRELAPQQPEWKTQQPFLAALERDIERLRTLSGKEYVEIMLATHTGMNTDAFNMIAKKWLDTAKHPRFKRLYTELVYQPMLEVMAYLRQSDFKVFIVSGGNVDFMRGYAERVYGVPAENVIGTNVKRKWVLTKKGPELLRLPLLVFMDNEEDKPLAIELHIGRRPVIAFGNSDGDLQMLQWAAAGRSKKKLMLLVHHDDAEREYRYDRTSPVGRLDRALDVAEKNGWNVISMKNDWRAVFAFERGDGIDQR